MGQAAGSPLATADQSQKVPSRHDEGGKGDRPIMEDGLGGLPPAARRPGGWLRKGPVPRPPGRGRAGGCNEQSCCPALP